MPLYAVIDNNNIVVNVVEWDGVTYWQAPDNTTVVLDDGTAVIGQAYSVNNEQGD